MSPEQKILKYKLKHCKQIPEKMNLVTKILKLKLVILTVSKVVKIHFVNDESAKSFNFKDESYNKR